MYMTAKAYEPCWFLDALPQELLVEILLKLSDFAQRHAWKTTCVAFYQAHHVMIRDRSNEAKVQYIKRTRIMLIGENLEQVGDDHHYYTCSILLLSALDGPIAGIPCLLQEGCKPMTMCRTRYYAAPVVYFDTTKHHLYCAMVDRDLVHIKCHINMRVSITCLDPAVDPTCYRFNVRGLEGIFYRNPEWIPSVLLYNMLLFAHKLIHEQGSWFTRMGTGGLIQSAITRFPFGWFEQVTLVLGLEKETAYMITHNSVYVEECVVGDNVVDRKQ